MNTMEMSADKWRDMIEDPRLVHDKDMAPLFIYGSLSRNPELVDGLPRCTGANVDSIYMLQLDFDGGETFDGFAERYKDYALAMYTSYSYGKKPGDRFRAIFRLKDPLPMCVLNWETKAEIMGLFPNADPTCFDRGHWQIIPCISRADAEYRYVYHAGKPLDLHIEHLRDMYVESEKAAESRRDVDAFDRMCAEMNGSGEERRWEAMMNKFLDAWEGVLEGSRNNELWGWLGWLSKNGVPEWMVRDKFIPPSDMVKEFEGMMQRLYV